MTLIKKEPKSIKYGRILIRLANTNDALKAYNIIQGQFSNLTRSKVIIDYKEFSQEHKEEKKIVRKILRLISIKHTKRTKEETKEGNHNEIKTNENQTNGNDDQEIKQTQDENACKNKYCVLKKKKTKKLDEYVDLQNYIECYNFCLRPELIIRGNRIVERKKLSAMKTIGLRELIAYCFYNYLKKNSIKKRKHLRICPYKKCGRYFIAQRTDSEYCWKCAPLNKLDKDYHRDDSRDRRYREQEITYGEMFDERYLWFREQHLKLPREEADKRAREYVLGELKNNKHIKVDIIRLDLERYLKSLLPFQTKYAVILDEKYKRDIKQDKISREEAEGRAREYALELLSVDTYISDDVVRSKLRIYITSTHQFK